MRLTLERLEQAFFTTSKAYHCEENDLPRSFGFLEKVGTGVQDAWPVLYAAARNEGIEVIDVLFCLRMSHTAINTVIEHILEPGDVKDVMTVVKAIRDAAEEKQSINLYALQSLTAWVSKTHMMNIANRVRNDQPTEA